MKKKANISPFNDMQHHNFLIYAGTMITINNQLKWKDKI